MGLLCVLDAYSAYSAYSNKKSLTIGFDSASIGVTMFGKIFDSMYKRSMVGAGAPVFAVWGYVIATHVPDKKVGSYVELNPALLATIIGEKEATIQEAIDFLCEPDANSTNPEHEGRRLVKVDKFGYQVVNGAKYRAIKDEEERREQNRQAAARFREKQRGKDDRKLKRGRDLPGEAAFKKLAENGATEAQLDRQQDSTLPDNVEGFPSI